MHWPFDKAFRRSGPSTPDWPNVMAELAGRARHPALKDFYERGAVAGDTPIESVPLAALDFETTGLDPNRHSIVSVGIVPFDIGRIRCRGSAYWVVQPRRELSQKSVTIHHITHDEIAAAPDIGEIVEELLAAMAGRVIVVHYRLIERRFFDRMMINRFGEGLLFPVIDTMSVEARMQPLSRPGVLGRLFGRRPVSLRLADSRARYHLPTYAPHHALTDALATAELLQAQVAHHYSRDTPVRVLWC